jgi:hypothetical protein
MFSDWHPAIHTMMIWLVTRVVNRYAFFIAVQILCFSLLAGHMAATLHAWGLRRGWVAAFAVCLLSARSTGVVLLFAIKDTMFSLLALALAAQMINIVLSEAAWLRNWPNRIAFAAVLALTTLVRHNGMFFTVPLLALLLILYVKKSTKECIITTAMAALMLCLVRGPLYSLAHVSRVPTQTYGESVGLPMTILCSVYRTEPEKLSPGAIALMEAIASEEEWAYYFVFGNYNSIKWSRNVGATLYNNVPPGELFLMTWRAVWAAPETSLRAMLSLTQVVWDPNVHDFYEMWPRAANFREDFKTMIREGIVVGISPEILEANCKNPAVKSIGREALAFDAEGFAKVNDAFRKVVQLLTPSRTLQSVGIAIFALMLAGGYSLHRRRGTGALLLIAPSILYNLGTMLLLCGPDYRFFQFNVMITMPLVLVCLARTPDTIRRTKRR